MAEKLTRAPRLTEDAHRFLLQLARYPDGAAPRWLRPRGSSIEAATRQFCRRNRLAVYNGRWRITPAGRLALEAEEPRNAE